MFFADLPTPAPVEQSVVVTASRAPQQQADTPVTITLIDDKRVERLGEPLLASVLRLVPSASLAVSGPAGSQSQLRIRGAEANHTLLFIDGIRANDPAAGNEPRLELLNTDLGDSLEVVRGPQSALWGAEAIGGVVAVRSGWFQGGRVSVEGGSSGYQRISAKAGMSSDRLDLTVGAGTQGARGINAFADGNGDRDGYFSRAARISAAYRPSPGLELGASGFAVFSRSEFDGIDPLTFRRADTLDESANRLAAGRISARYEQVGWNFAAALSSLYSRNRNLLADEEQNRTSARRTVAQVQVERSVETGTIRHQLIFAGEASGEQFSARDTLYGGQSNQSRDRGQAAFTAEWRAAAGPLIADAALRRDQFNRFKDATTFRGALLVKLDRRWSATLSYGEGIAQPSFFDLYGFFPGSFEGNPSLRPERSRGLEAGLRYAGEAFSGSAALYRQKLSDEIITVFDPVSFNSTTTNAVGESKRRGIELEARWIQSDRLRLSATYSYLRASERTDPLGRSVKELRRPRHSGSIAADGEIGRFSYGAAISFTGDRTDQDFDVFPATTVRLASYWLAGGRLAFEVTDGVELFTRVTNALDQEARDVVGYRTEGRSAYAGIRLGFGR